MKRKRPRDTELGRNLDGNRQGPKHRGHAHGRQVPPQVGRGDVCDAEDVEAAGEEDAGDALERGEHGANLPFVDFEMGGEWAVEALADEDLLGFFTGTDSGSWFRRLRPITSCL